jgi:hypothetical protein
VARQGVDAAATDRFWRRKVRELEFVRSFTDEPYTGDVVSSLPAYLGAVRELRERLRMRQTQASAHLFETSLVGADTYDGQFGSVSYTYQRYDLETIGFDWLSRIYARRADQRAVRGMFLSSGMSTIAAAFLHIARRGYRRISISPRAYFETRDLCSRFFAQLELEPATDALGSDADVIWLDTSSTAWPPLSTSDERTKLMVVDTTCVEGSGDVVAAWMQHSQIIGCPLLFLRSHLKLDTFGLELGRLGSIVAIAPDANQDDVEEMSWNIQHARAGFGFGFELPNVYPWLGLPEFFELSRDRADGIRAVTDRLATAVDAARRHSDAFEIVRTDHRLFFLVRTGITFPSDEVAKGSRLARAVAARCEDDGSPVIPAGSFGLDLIALMDFVDREDGLHYLRVAGADLPLEDVALIGQHVRDTIAEWPRIR